MGRFRMWLTELMRGRYGVDQLNRFLLVVTMVLIIIDMFTRSRILHFVTLILLIYTYSRMFSRNISARMGENQRFMQLVGRFRGGRGKSAGGGFDRQGGRSSGGYGFGRSRDPEHKILRCPVCGEKLRVPRNAGKIRIKCPHCGEQFTKKV